MINYEIISDGSCDLSPAEAVELNVQIVPFYVVLNDQYLKEGKDIEINDIYQQMIDNPHLFPKTSLPSTQDYIEVFKPVLESGKDIICLCITRKFSGSYNSALNAKQILLEDYPERKITIIDTMVNTVLQGLVVKEAARMRDLGYDYDKLIEIIETNKLTGRIFFTVKGLSYLQHGGRIGKLSSLLGDFLKITPIITLKDGEIFSEGIAIKRSRSLLKIRDILKKYVEDNNVTPDKYEVVVGYGYDLEEANEFVNLLRKTFPNFNFNIAHIGATIAVHTGPHPLGIGIIKKFDA